MKKTVILLLCLSLMMCTGCAGKSAEPTLAPTMAPTEDPTQEPTQEPTAPPTQAPTAPPLPAGPIDAELKWVGTLNSNLDISNVYKYWSRPLHSEKEIREWLIDFLVPILMETACNGCGKSIIPNMTTPSSRKNLLLCVLLCKATKKYGGMYWIRRSAPKVETTWWK